MQQICGRHSNPAFQPPTPKRRRDASFIIITNPLLPQTNYSCSCRYPWAALFLQLLEFRQLRGELMQHFVHGARLLEEASSRGEGADHVPHRQRGYTCLLAIY